MKRPQYNHVLNSEYPNLNWELEGDYEYEKIQWHLSEGQTPPSKEVLESKLTKLQADYDSKKYQRDRAVAYPPLGEQMDILYHGGVDALKAELKKTKDKYPKP